jgi:excinuclease ABC subunit A
MKMSRKELIIEGARQNNLRNINLRLPHNRVIAITGVSGSGKSSLAFDTIFAEGQWRFIESLSTYARLFLEKLDRPDVDLIQNVRPAVALEQKNPVRGSRSTVGSLTELYELFRILYSKISTPFCLKCGKEIRKWDPSQIVFELVHGYSGKRAMILFESKDYIPELRKRGFHRFWFNGDIRESEDIYKDYDNSEAGENISSVSRVPSLDVVLDRLVIRDEPRLSDSIELAWREGKGKIKVLILSSSDNADESALIASISTLSFSSENSCEECVINLPDPTPLLFSFNHPVGACPECKGFGNTLDYAEDLIIPDKSLSLSQGAVDPWNKPAYKWWRKQLLKKAKKAGLDVNKPFEELSHEQKSLLFKGSDHFYGIDDFFEDMESRKYKLHVRVFLSRYRRAVTCNVCGGKRIRQEAVSYKINGLDIAELCRLPISETLAFFINMDISPFGRNLAKELLKQIIMKLEFLKNVDLEYLTLDRHSKTLSGGEFQRINLSNQIAALLTGTLYVLDEPTVGLHPRDTDRIAKIMNRLAEHGNTVIVVEHDRGMIEASDWIVELGPGGGYKGGNVVFTGNKYDFLKTDTLTSRYIRGVEIVNVPAKKRIVSDDVLSLFSATGNNLKNVDFHIPLKRLTVVTGVSGSGKSSLVVETLYRALSKNFRTSAEPPLPYERIEGNNSLKGVKLIDQSPIGRSPRSNPVTYLKIFDHIRKLFADQREAKAYGYEAGYFSFNVQGGRCETCKGQGYQLVEMYFFENLFVKCEKCRGKRYKSEALRIKYRERNIDDILKMTVEEAYSLFEDYPAIKSKLALMMDTGLGYLRLGQPSTTLSGGEAQRLKICAEMGTMASGNYLYILDEPTVGLHFDDVKALLNVLNRLVDLGNTVLIIEHNLDVVKTADWIIDLGPEGGDHGGEIISEGTHYDIINSKRSYTGEYLRNYINRARIEKSA